MSPSSSRAPALPSLIASLAADIRVQWRELCVVACLLTILLSSVTVLRGQLHGLDDARRIDSAAMERDISRLDELEKRYRGGDVALAPDIEKLQGDIALRLRAIAGEAGPPDIEAVARVLLSYALSFLILLTGFVWAMARMVGTHALSWRTVAEKVTQEFLPQTLLLCVLGILTGVWIPLAAVLRVRIYPTQLSADLASIQVWLLFCGYLAIVVLAPRLILAPLIRFREPMPAGDALRGSVAATRGYWEKMLGNLVFVACTVLVVAFAVRNAFLFFLSPFLLPVVASFFWVTGAMLMGGFLVKLGDAILASQGE